MSSAIDGTLEFEQAFHLTHHGRTSTFDAANALLAMERLTLRAPLAINRMMGRAAIKDTQVFLHRVEDGSFFHKHYVRLFFGNARKEAEFYAWLRNTTGMDNSKVRTLFAIVGTGIVAAGAYYAIQRYVSGPSANDKAATVLAWNNTIIQIGAGELKMTPQEFSAVLDRAIPRKATNARDAAKLLKPAKEGDSSAIMKIVDHEELNVPAAVVAAIPKPEEIEEPAADTEVLHPQVEVFLRATDLDSLSRGWAALVPDVADKRLKLELGPGINPESLYGKKKVIGDVVAVMRAHPGRESSPVRYRIVKINAD